MSESQKTDYIAEEIYYDRQGNPITREEWGKKWQDRGGSNKTPGGYDTDSYRRVGYDSDGDVTISTVWLGMDHGFGEGPPIIFETMVFGGQYADECDRYSTEQEAVDGHVRWVKKAITEKGC